MVSHSTVLNVNLRQLFGQCTLFAFSFIMTRNKPKNHAIAVVVLVVANMLHADCNIHFVSFGLLFAAAAAAAVAVVNHISVVVVVSAIKLAAAHKLLSKCYLQDTSVFQMQPPQHHKTCACATLRMRNILP